MARAKKPAPQAREEVETKLGRPTIFSEEIADEICERMVEGEDLVRICRDDHLPARSTIYKWMAENSVFRTRIACAREGLADFVASKIADLSEGTTDETANADRVRLAALQWRAARLAPRRYSEKHITEISGPDGAPVQIQSQVIDARALTEEQREVLKQALLAAKGDTN